MTDLRTRIYDIVWRELAYDGDDFCGHLADVLIRELPELHALRRCERCRKPCHINGFPPVRDGSEELRPFCIPCTNYIEWTTS